jgi:hypothetical protein
MELVGTLLQMVLPEIETVDEFESRMQACFEESFERLEPEDIGLEENDEPAHGIFRGNEGSIYSYTNWFYDGDESAFSVL